MSEKLTTAGDSWRFSCAAPPREVFAVMEQMVGTHPYRFEVVGPDAARIIEVARCGFFGQWKQHPPRPGWVRVRAVAGDAGTAVVVVSSRRPRNLTRGRRGVPGAPSRALQIVQLLTRGGADERTVYRDSRLPHGPVTLVASWAGTPYRLFAAPAPDAERGREIYTASRLVAINQRGSFVHVQLTDGTGGWVERDQVVAAPAAALRAVHSGASSRPGNARADVQ